MPAPTAPEETRTISRPAARCCAIWLTSCSICARSGCFLASVSTPVPSLTTMRLRCSSNLGRMGDESIISFRHGPLRGDEAFVAADQRGHVFVTHALGDLGSKDAAITAAAIENDFAIIVGIKAFNVSLENATAEMLRFDGVPGLPFAVFANIDQNGIAIFAEARAGLIDRDFFHVGSRFVDDFQESGRMIHVWRVTGGKELRQASVQIQKAFNRLNTCAY